MALTVNSALIAAQAQTYAAQTAKSQPRSFSPPPVEKLAARAGDTAVRVELSAQAADKAADADRAREDARAAQDARRAGDGREFAREAPLKSAQQDAGTRATRPGATLDIRI